MLKSPKSTANTLTTSLITAKVFKQTQQISRNIQEKNKEKEKKKEQNRSNTKKKKKQNFQKNFQFFRKLKNLVGHNTWPPSSKAKCTNLAVSGVPPCIRDQKCLNGTLCLNHLLSQLLHTSIGVGDNM